MLEDRLCLWLQNQTFGDNNYVSTHFDCFGLDVKLKTSLDKFNLYQDLIGLTSKIISDDINYMKYKIVLVNETIGYRNDMPLRYSFDKPNKNESHVYEPPSIYIGNKDMFLDFSKETYRCPILIKGIHLSLFYFCERDADAIANDHEFVEGFSMSNYV